MAALKFNTNFIYRGDINTLLSGPRQQSLEIKISGRNNINDAHLSQVGFDLGFSRYFLEKLIIKVDHNGSDEEIEEVKRVFRILAEGLGNNQSLHEVVLENCGVILGADDLEGLRPILESGPFLRCIKVVTRGAGVGGVAGPITSFAMSHFIVSCLVNRDRESKWPLSSLDFISEDGSDIDYWSDSSILSAVGEYIEKNTDIGFDQLNCGRWSFGLDNVRKLVQIFHNKAAELHKLGLYVPMSGVAIRHVEESRQSTARANGTSGGAKIRRDLLASLIVSVNGAAAATAPTIRGTVQSGVDRDRLDLLYGIVKSNPFLLNMRHNH